MDVEQETQTEQQAPIDIGAMLIAARKNKNWSTKDVASKLNLAAATIEKIESNQFDGQLPVIFIRGYISAYAKKVGLDAETLTTAFDQQTQAQVPTINQLKPLSRFDSSRKEINSSNIIFKLITYLIVLLLIAFAAWEAWKKFVITEQEPHSQSTSIQATTTQEITLNDLPATQQNKSALAETEAEDNSQPQQLQAQESVKENPDVQQNQSVTESSQQQVSEQQNNEQEYSEQEKVQQENNELISQTSEQPASLLQEKPIVRGENLSAQFVFSGDCWLKVTDANGEVLAIGVKKNAKVMLLQGVAPLNVILGDPAVVDITVDGRKYDLSGYTAGRTAKFQLNDE